MGIFGKLVDKLNTKNTLYYPGCLTRYVATDLLENYRSILRAAGIEFIELEGKELCCGSPVLKAGYAEDFAELARKNLALFKEFGVGRIITSCPACSFVLDVKYREVLGEDWNLKVEHVVETLSGKFKVQRKKAGVVTYHDPCHLGKQRGIFGQPRELIKSAGFEIKEMDLARVNSFCCGGGGGLSANNPELAERIAKNRLGQARDIDVKKMITSCPLCYLHMKKNSKQIEVIELSQVLK